MFKHILVPVDGSETAQKAVEKAAGLAKAFGSNNSSRFINGVLGSVSNLVSNKQP